MIIMSKSDILAVLKKESNLTTNAIGKALGMTKASKGLRDLVDSMVGTELVADNSGRYTTYSVAAAKVEPNCSEYVAIKKNPASTMNAIGKSFGMAKPSSMLKATVQALVEQGHVVEDTSGRYTTYSVAGSEVAEVASISPCCKKEKKEKSNKIKVATPSELKSVEIKGYSLSTGKSGKLKVKCPNQSTITLKDDEYLLVINDEPLWAVKTAKDVLRCFASYAADKNYATYVVKDAVSGKIIGDISDSILGDDRLLMVEIKRHNKAA
jgi:hypothetical protein